MLSNADKKQKNNSQSLSNAISQKKSSTEPTFQFVDNRPEAIAGRKLQEMANQLSAPQQQILQKKANNTGLPDQLKNGIEKLSGYSMDGVKVHRNSDKPAQLQAHAYAQGTDIHLGPGQEKHLPHEAWHVVQQKQGRVKPTMQMKGNVNVNDDAGLEKEADIMGEKALHISGVGKQHTSIDSRNSQTSTSAPLQRIRIKLDHADDRIMNNVRAAKVPRPGTKTVDGFKDYNNDHQEIKNDENIVLEGHGTYLHSDHQPNVAYDSQAELTPQQLANIAFMIPKHEQWHGQIILFGCATGVLTLEVSKHYLALSGKSVNVVGTLADIKMEVPDETHLSHRAEYNETKKGFPKAPSPKGPFSSHKAVASQEMVASPSARAKFLQWVNEAKTRTMDILHAIAIFNESLESEINKEVRIELIYKLSESLQYFKRTLATKLNYEGLTYNKDTDIDKDVQSIRGLLGVANDELIHFKALLAHPDSEQRLLEDEAHKYNLFFDHLMSELSVLERLAIRSEKSVPSGVVDWEGGNVMNSKADDAGGLPTEPLSKAELTSDKWGRRGGAGHMLVQTQVH